MAVIRGMLYVLMNLRKTYEKRLFANNKKKTLTENGIRFRNLNMLHLLRILKESYLSKVASRKIMN